jgi:hypothetical protein
MSIGISSFVCEEPRDLCGVLIERMLRHLSIEYDRMMALMPREAIYLFVV